MKRKDKISLLVESAIKQAINEPRSVVKEVYDESRQVIGNCVGIVYHERRDVNSWINKEMVDKQVREALSKATDKSLFPMAILETIRINESHRGQGYGRKVLKDFFKQVNECRTVMLTADLKQLQQEGFGLVEWYKKNGFVPIGKSASNIVMIKVMTESYNQEKFGKFLKPIQDVLQAAEQGKAQENKRGLQGIEDIETDEGYGSLNDDFELSIKYGPIELQLFGDGHVGATQTSAGRPGTYYDPPESPEHDYEYDFDELTMHLIINDQTVIEDEYVSEVVDEETVRKIKDLIKSRFAL